MNLKDPVFNFRNEIRRKERHCKKEYSVTVSFSVSLQVEGTVKESDEFAQFIRAKDFHNAINCLWNHVSCGVSVSRGYSLTNRQEVYIHVTLNKFYKTLPIPKNAKSVFDELGRDFIKNVCNKAIERAYYQHVSYKRTFACA